MAPSLRFQIALTLIKGLGPVTAKRLLAVAEPEEIFLSTDQVLKNNPAISPLLANAILQFNDWDRVAMEMDFIDRNGIEPLFITAPGYPPRLLPCEDGPLLLYYKGKAALHANRMLAVVGTRQCSTEGKRATERLLEQLAPYNVTIVSGLAYGIDAAAHRAAIGNGLPTIAVLPQGLDQIHPAGHRPLASDILRSSGGLLTESMKGHSGEKFLFPRRNRIVAGLCDATVVIESAAKGGSLITARLSADYGRDVFAQPGRPTDSKSEGCNTLIKQQRALLFTHASDITDWLGWSPATNNGDQPEKKEKPQKSSGTQAGTSMPMSDTEAAVIQQINSENPCSIELLADRLALSQQQLAHTLINLELAGRIVSLPGRRFIPA